MHRLTATCLAFALLAAPVPAALPATAGSAAENSVRGPDAPSLRLTDPAQRNTSDGAESAAEEIEPDTVAAATAATEPPDDSGPEDARLSDPEQDGPEPLVPIEIQQSIRVNANVNLPQDI